MKNFLFVCVAALSFAAAGCVGYEHTSSITTPTTTTAADVLAGSWQSVQDTSPGIIPDPNTCTNFVWTAATQTSTSASGSFSATCNGVAYAGTASGTLTGPTSAQWTANGTGTTANMACGISLTGTAQLTGTTITVPYSGTTCLGPVSGTQTLTKK